MTDAADACGIQLSMIRPPAHQGLALADLVGWPTGRGCGATNAAVGFDDTTVAAFVAIGLRRGPLRIKASLADSDRATRLAAAEECCAGIERAAVLGLGAVSGRCRETSATTRRRAAKFARRETLPPVVAHVKRCGLRSALKNCPFEGRKLALAHNYLRQLVP